MQVPFNDLKRVNELYREAIEQAVARVSASGWYIRGNECSRFEEQFARWCNSPCCIGTGNGLDALKLILLAYRQMGLLKADDEVLVPANTYIATILAISQAGLCPVPVEPRTDTCNIDPEQIEQQLTTRSKAIMPVHLYGRVCDMDALHQISRKYQLLLIDDAAQAHGAQYKGNRTGSLCDATAFSFYPTKILGAMGDAGAVCTPNHELADIVRALASYGAARRYENLYKGINSRLDEMQAAILLAKLPNLQNDIDKRLQIARRYLAEIKNPHVILPQQGAENEHVFHLFTIRCPRRTQLIESLRRQGIETQVHYPTPPHLQPAYSEWNGRTYSITETIHKETVSLPLFVGMSHEEIDRVIEAVNNFQA